MLNYVNAVKDFFSNFLGVIMKYRTLPLVMALFVLSFLSLQAQNYWTETKLLKTGPVKNIAFTSSGAILAGTTTGVIKSTNGGTSWTKVINGFQGSMDITALGPGRGNDIFAVSSVALYRTTNEGASWQLILTGDEARNYTSFSVSSSGSIFVGSTGKVFRSDDNGATWQTMTGDLDSKKEVTGVFAQKDNMLFVGILNEGLFVTQDDGITFVRVCESIKENTVESFAVNSKGYIYVGAKINGMWRSKDDGMTWELSKVGFANINYTPTNISILKSGDIVISTVKDGVYYSSDDGDVFTSATGEMKYFGVPVMGANKSDVLFANTASDGLWSSNTKGKSWTKVNPDMKNLEIYSIVNVDKNKMYLGSTDGFYMSSDKGMTWTLGGLKAKTVYHVALSGTKIIASTITGIFSSSDFGVTFSESQKGIGALATNQVLVASTGKMYAALSSAEGLYISVDGGNSWVASSNGLTDKRVLRIYESKTGVLFAATGAGVFKSSDNGSTWKIINALKNVNICDMATGTGTIIYAAGYGTNSGIYKSIDNGDSWRYIEPPEMNSSPQQLLVNSVGYVYAAVKSGGACMSIDDGENWKNISSGLASQNAFSLGLNSDDYLFIGTQLGLYKSSTVSSDNPYNIPEAPTKLKIARSGLTFVLSWKASVSANVTYRVYKKIDGGEFNLLADNITALEYTDNAVQVDSLCTYVVRAYWTDKKKESENSNEVSAKISSAIEAPPAVKITPLLNQLKLDWERSLSIGNVKYRVYRSTESGKNYEKISETADTTYTDENVEAKKYFYYVIRTISEDGTKESGNSAEVYAMPSTAPEAPKNVVLKTTPASIILSWDASPSPNINYRIYRSVNDAKHWNILVEDYTELSYEDKDVTTENMYYYYVKSYNDALILESERSDEMAGKPGTTASVSENNTAFGMIEVGPNPSSDQLKVEFKSGIETSAGIRLINCAGSVAADFGRFDVSAGLNVFNLNTGKISSGSYYLMIRSGNDAFAIPVAIVK